MRAAASRLTYANVVATLALIVALGGGAAMALSGSGSVKSANIATPEFEESTRLMRLDGIGKLRVACDEVGLVGVHLRNNSGKKLVVTRIAANESFTNPGAYYYWNEIPDGESEGIGGIGGGKGSHATSWFSIFPAGDADRPQASLIVNVERDCVDGKVSVLATSTESAR
jgi:hypothetical protein